MIAVTTVPEIPRNQNPPVSPDQFIFEPAIKSICRNKLIYWYQSIIS